MEGLELSGGFHAPHRRHPDVHENDVGLRRGRQLDRLGSGGGLRDDLEHVGGEQHNQGFPEPGVVVHDEHAYPGPDPARRRKGSELDHASYKCQAPVGCGSIRRGGVSLAGIIGERLSPSD
jgi:hypothetical protein